MVPEIALERLRAIMPALSSVFDLLCVPASGVVRTERRDGVKCSTIGTGLRPEEASLPPGHGRRVAIFSAGLTVRSRSIMIRYLFFSGVPEDSVGYGYEREA